MTPYEGHRSRHYLNRPTKPTGLMISLVRRTAFVLVLLCMALCMQLTMVGTTILTSDKAAVLGMARPQNLTPLETV